MTQSVMVWLQRGLILLVPSVKERDSLGTPRIFRVRSFVEGAVLFPLKMLAEKKRVEIFPTRRVWFISDPVD